MVLIRALEMDSGPFWGLHSCDSSILEVEIVSKSQRHSLVKISEIAVFEMDTLEEKARVCEGESIYKSLAIG